MNYFSLSLWSSTYLPTARTYTLYMYIQLVALDPSHRPSAAELLESGELPGKLEVEEVYFKEALGTLTNPQSLSYGRLVKALFEHSNPPEIDATYDFDWITQSKALMAKELVGRESICDHVRSVFQLHGALPLSAPLFRPRPAPPSTESGGGGGGVYNNNTHYHHHHHHHHQSGGGGVGLVSGPDFLDPDGAVLRLPTDLLVPFARYIARTEVTHMKRYEVSKIYRKQEAGGHPREEISAQLDMIYDARSVDIGQGQKKNKEDDGLMFTTTPFSFYIHTDIPQAVKSWKLK